MCIIVSKEINDKFILAKNRDRAYKPVLEVVHTLLNGVEVAYLHDITTDWSEGINEFGIGAVNSALIVDADEAEKRIVKKQGPGPSGKKMRFILEQKTLKNAIRACLMAKFGEHRGLRGHTFISSPHHMVSVELTGNGESDIKTHNIKHPVVRTNHGHIFTNAGYTDGIKYLSSKMRKISAEKTIERVKDWTEVAPAMRNQYFEHESQLNMRRTTPTMFTSSQTVMNLTDRIIEIEWFEKEVKEFRGINNQLPKGYKPKIRIIIDKIHV